MIAVLAAGEACWRLTGVPPRSDLLIFDRFRDAVRDSPQAAAMIGSSRFLCDLDPTTLQREMPDRQFYQLAIDGGSSLPMLENLAHDASFRGFVLAEFSVTHFLTDYPFLDKKEGESLQYVRFIDRHPLTDFASAWTVEHLSLHSAMFSARGLDFFGTARVRIAQMRRHEPAVPESTRRDDRFFPLHRRGQDNTRALAGWQRIAKAESRAEGDNGMAHVPGWVKAIRRRGGDVVFVRMPLAGSLKRQEDDDYPDRHRLIQSLEAERIIVIDFETEPSLRDFDCPDESHLDAEDAERFTVSLARILKARVR